MFSESARFAKSVPNTLKVHIYLYHWAVQDKPHQVAPCRNKSRAMGHDCMKKWLAGSGLSRG